MKVRVIIKNRRGRESADTDRLCDMTIGDFISLNKENLEYVDSIIIKLEGENGDGSTGDR